MGLPDLETLHFLANSFLNREFAKDVVSGVDASDGVVQIMFWEMPFTLMQQGREY